MERSDGWMFHSARPFIESFIQMCTALLCTLTHPYAHSIHSLNDRREYGIEDRDNIGVPWYRRFNKSPLTLLVRCK